MNIEQQVISTVATRFDVTGVRIVSETSLRSLGADSLDMVDIVTELEDIFGVSIPDEEIDKLRTIKDVAECVEKHMHC